METPQKVSADAARGRQVSLKKEDQIKEDKQKFVIIGEKDTLKQTLRSIYTSPFNDNHDTSRMLINRHNDIIDLVELYHVQISLL